MSEADDVLDAADAARAIGIDLDELYALAAQGELRPVPLGWRLRFRRSELRGFAARNQDLLARRRQVHTGQFRLGRRGP